MIAISRSKVLGGANAESPKSGINNAHNHLKITYMKPVLRFSWKAILLAPLAVPLLTGLVLALSVNGPRVHTFLFFFSIACVFAYGATLCVLLPGLFLASLFLPLTTRLTAAIGIVLGLMVYFPFGWISYCASGDNSGPPAISFAAYLWQQGPGEAWPFPLGGLITALAYWFLARPRKHAGPSTEFTEQPQV